MKFNELIGKIKYKPGFEFKVGVVNFGTGQWALNIDHRTTCVVNNTPTIICHSSGFLDGQFNSENDFIMFVFEALKRDEIHELQEHFYYDGEIFIDPHETEKKFDKARIDNVEKYILFKDKNADKTRKQKPLSEKLETNPRANLRTSRK